MVIQIKCYAEMGIKYAPNSSLIRACLLRLSSGRDFSLNYNTIDNELKWITGELVMEFVKKFPRNTTFTEDDVFKKVMEWTNNECLRQAQDVTVENVREIMLPFMAHFDPSKFLPITVTTTVKNYKLLAEDELIQCLADHLVKSVEENLQLRRNGNNNGYHGGNVRNHGNEYYPAPFFPAPARDVLRGGHNRDARPAAISVYEYDLLNADRE